MQQARRRHRRLVLIRIGRVDNILATLHDDGSLGGWPESDMLAPPAAVGPGARVMSRGNASGALVAGDGGLLAFVTLVPSGACKVQRDP